MSQVHKNTGGLALYLGAVSALQLHLQVQRGLPVLISPPLFLGAIALNLPSAAGYSGVHQSDSGCAAPADQALPTTFQEEPSLLSFSSSSAP